MKRWVRLMTAVVVAVAALPTATASAKITVCGALWTTYWAQRQASELRYLVSDGGIWVDDAQTGQPTARKTFLLAQNQSGGGLRAQAVTGNGLVLGAAAPVNDGIRLYGEFNTTGGAFGLNYAYAEIALPHDLTLTVGQQDVPFGNEYTVRPGIGCCIDEVFISEFTQAPAAALLPGVELGVSVSGPVVEGLADFSISVLTGSLPSAADSAGVTGWIGGLDNNDAKSVGARLEVRPHPCAFVIASFLAGDYSNPFRTDGRAKYTASGLALGYAPVEALQLTGEWAATRHDGLMYDFGMGSTAPAGALTAARVNEYIVKAIWTGIPDFELGVRYGVVDPKNLEAEVDAGFAKEEKLTFGVLYFLAENMRLKAEYSRVRTALDYFDLYDAATLGAGATAVVSNDPRDDIFALQIALQF